MTQPKLSERKQVVPMVPGMAGIAGKGRLEALNLLARRRLPEREFLQRFQSRQLQRLVNHAYESVPYYRSFFERNGFHPSQLNGLESLSQLPITGKEDMLSVDPADLVSKVEGPGHLLSKTTTGSTGRPFTIRCSRFEDKYLRALRLKNLRRLGLRVTDKRAYIIFHNPQAWQSRMIKLASLVGFYPLFKISPFLDPKEIVQLLSSMKPDILQGYANIVYLVSLQADEMGIKIRPRLIFVGGESLTPGMRRQIESTFRCPVREIYGSHEFNMIAWECHETNQLHVCEEGVILEVLRDGKPVASGERGEIVVTALHSFAQPFIRFSLGDIVTKGKDVCFCGEPFSTILAVEGRMADRIILPDGRMASPFVVFSYLVQQHPWVGQHQMIQESEHFVVLRLVPSRHPRPDELAAVEQEIMRFLGSEVRFRVDLLPSIPLAPEEKFRVSRSYVQSHYDDSD